MHECTEHSAHRLALVRERARGRNGRSAARLQGLSRRLVPLQAGNAVLHLLRGEELIITLGVLDRGRHNAQARDVTGPRRGCAAGAQTHSSSKHGAARRDRLQTTLHAGTGRARRRLDLQLLSRREAEGERRDGEHPAKGRRTGEEAGGPALPACCLHERVRLRPCALRSSQHKNFGRFLANPGVSKRTSANFVRVLSSASLPPPTNNYSFTPTNRERIIADAALQALTHSKTARTLAWAWRNSLARALTEALRAESCRSHPARA